MLLFPFLQGALLFTMADLGDTTSGAPRSPREDGGAADSVMSTDVGAAPQCPLCGLAQRCPWCSWCPSPGPSARSPTLSEQVEREELEHERLVQAAEAHYTAVPQHPSVSQEDVDMAEALVLAETVDIERAQAQLEEWGADSATVRTEMAAVWRDIDRWFPSAGGRM